MNNDWSTKEEDLQAAQQIMEEYAIHVNRNALGLFELVVDKKAKRMNFQIADWVLKLAEHFHATYGAIQGDFVVRQIISRCLTNGETLH